MTEQHNDIDTSTRIEAPQAMLHTPETTVPAKGSKLGAIAGAVITVAFFMPWVRACGIEPTGYEIASNQVRGVEDAWVYWLILLGGLACIVLFFWMKPTHEQIRRRAARLRLAAGIIGFIPVLNIWANIRHQEGKLDVLYGFWLITLGYIGVIWSFFIDPGKGHE